MRNRFSRKEAARTRGTPRPLLAATAVFKGMACLATASPFCDVLSYRQNTKEAAHCLRRVSDSRGVGAQEQIGYLSDGGRRE
jgi:hypothetical protein